MEEAAGVCWAHDRELGYVSKGTRSSTARRYVYVRKSGRSGQVVVNIHVYPFLRTSLEYPR